MDETRLSNLKQVRGYLLDCRDLVDSIRSEESREFVLSLDYMLEDVEHYIRDEEYEPDTFSNCAPLSHNSVAGW